MKRHTWQTAAFLVVLLAAAAAAGQNNRAVLAADIPFPFVVANHTLPAGHYELGPIGDQGLIRIGNSDNQAAFGSTFKVQRRTPESSGKIVFHRYQGTYFLTQIWSPTQRLGRQLYESDAEKELESLEINKDNVVLRAQK
jgi:hypothetical protein